MRFFLGDASLGATGQPTQVAAKKSSNESPFARLAKSISIGLALILLGFGSTAHAAGNPNSGNTLFNTASPYCMECHISPPEGGRLTAANKISVIQNAIANDYGGTYTPGGTTGMGRFSTGGTTLTTTQLNNLSAYFGWYVAPAAADQTATVAYASTSNVIDLSGAITAGTGTPESISIVSGPNNGGTINSSSVVVGTNVVASVNYKPAATFIGTETFTYSLTNRTGTSATRTVTVTVSAPPAPVTSAASPNVAYGSTNNVIDLSANITGYTTGNIVIVSAPANGTINGTTGTTITYTPNGAPFVGGADPFTYQIVGPGGTSNTSTVSLTVGAPPPPVANPVTVAAAYNSSNNAYNLSSSITNPVTSVAVSTGPTKGTIVSVVGTTVTYTPNPGIYSQNDTFSYTATGAGGGPSAPAVVTIQIGAPPAPTVGAGTLTVPFNTAGTIDLSTLVTGPLHSVALASTAAHGTVSLSGNVVTYTPTAGYSGPDSFTYTATAPGVPATSAGVTSAPATVTVTVSSLIPTAGAATMTVPLNTATTLDLAPYITGSSITGVSIAANPAHGTVAVNGTRVTFTPVNNYFGADSFTYLAYGNAGTSAAAGLVTVSVVGRPDPTRDTTVTALITAQAETARRFSRAQISNFQSRMEALHRRIDAPETDTPSGGASSSFNTPRPTTLAAAAAKGFARDAVPAANASPSSGAAYRPAASLGGDPAAGLMPAQPSGPGSALAAVTAAISGGAKPSEPPALIGKAIGMVASAAQNSTLNLNSSTGDGSTSSVGDVDIWAGGSVRYGTRDAGSTTGSTFSSDGVSFGADKRISDQLAVGVGFGHARDRTEIGTDGSLSDARSTTVAVYASYQPTPNTFVDGLLGYGTLKYDTNRYIVPIGQYATGKRDGDFLFASLAAGYEYRTTGLLVSPYGRIDLASHRLNAATETGAGLYALHYYSQRIPSVSGALGLRFESAHETGFGYVTPRLRVEYQHDFKGEQAAAVSYADQIGGTTYTVPATSTSRNSVVLGVGSDFVFGRGLRVAVDYQTQRASATDHSQAIFVKLVKDLDGRTERIPTYALGSRGFGVNLDGGITSDDNVTRSSASATRLSDTVYSFNASKPFTISLTDNWRIGLNAFAGAEKFKVYTGLDRIFGGGEAALQYRESGEFGSPIYSLFANFAADEYNSELRDGKRLSLGLSMRKAFTDRISIYAALAKNSRYARSDVFNTRDYSARVNVDYSITPESTLYLTGEFRRGDIVSTGEHTLANVNIARVFSRDDAFTRQGLYAYRADGRTVLLTMGYNMPLGTQDSLDFSVRRVLSEASLDSNTGAGRPRYHATQFSLIYLTSF